jgi:Tfp pilus assembly protein PilN
VRELNLAHRPFVNLKPIRRAGLLLLSVALGMLVLNAMLYWEHFTGEGRTRSRSQELTKRIEAEEAEVERLRRQIATLDIEGLNRRTRFVNLEIDRRRFGWSRLFDQLAQVQPGTVRLLSMTPRFVDDKRSRRGRRVAPDEVTVELQGVAKSGEAILEFIDGLFLHAAFRDPDLSRESLREDGMSRFSLSVAYIPGAGESPTSKTAEDSGVDEAVGNSPEEIEEKDENSREDTA